jgi:hypothetical protein
VAETYKGQKKNAKNWHLHGRNLKTVFQFPRETFTLFVFVDRKHESVEGTGLTDW